MVLRGCDPRAFGGVRASAQGAVRGAALNVARGEEEAAVAVGPAKRQLSLAVERGERAEHVDERAEGEGEGGGVGGDAGATRAGVVVVGGGGEVDVVRAEHLRAEVGLRLEGFRIVQGDDRQPAQWSGQDEESIASSVPEIVE